MKISVLTPAYNAADYIRELLLSVQSQQDVEVEHLVIDDGSTDETLTILRSMPGVRVIHRANRGQYATQNELLALATGDVIVVICADDYFADARALARVAQEFEADPALEVVVGRTPRRVEGTRPYVVRPDIPVRLAVRTVGQCLAVQHCSVFVKRDLLVDHGIRFDESYRMRGDWDWLIRVFHAAQRVKAINTDLGVWRHHPNQTSATAAEQGRQETERLLKSHDIQPWRYRALRQAYALNSRLAHAGALAHQHGLGFVWQKIRPATSS